MFWTIAAALLLVAAFITFSPLLRANSLWKPLALALVFVVPAIAAWMYTQIGTPEGIKFKQRPPPPRSAQSVPSEEGHSPESQEMNTMISGLQARLAENPDDLDGWMLLARTFKATERFPEAVEALEKANLLDPGNPYIMVEIVEANIFLAPNGRINDEMIATLQQALASDPGMQKALWLMGIASSQKGDVEAATGYWETLLAQLEPGSSVAQSVQSQIDQVKSKAEMGMAVEESPAATTEPADDGSWQGLSVSVIAGESVQSRIPTGGVLYIMIRSSGPAMGPPLGVRRIIDPSLPVEISVSDSDSMLKERLISSESSLQFQARISLTGSPAAQTGDWQSATQTISLDSNEAVELVIDQRVE